MKRDRFVIDILSDKTLYMILQKFKTESWKTFDSKVKEKYLKKVNSHVCDLLGVGDIELVVKEEKINLEDLSNRYKYKNVTIDSDARLSINDVEYNQYLTLYEYFYRIRQDIQQLVYTGEFKDKFSGAYKEQLKRNFRFANMGSVSVEIPREEGNDLEDYQFCNKDAKEFAQTILFEIINRNYNGINGHDEEEFMANPDILSSSFLDEQGEILLQKEDLEKYEMIYKLEKMNKKIHALDEKDLSSIKDEDLFFIIYPTIIKNSDPCTVVRAFNEIAKRIYGYDMNIVISKKGFSINDREYNFDEIPNMFNHLLRECLLDMDENLRKDNDTANQYETNEDLEERIMRYKKRWLFSVVKEIDNSLNPNDFGVFKYQTLYRLLNKEKLNELLYNSCNSNTPCKKRRSK